MERIIDDASRLESGKLCYIPIVEGLESEGVFANRQSVVSCRETPVIASWVYI
jgi:hypothetical protein